MSRLNKILKGAITEEEAEKIIQGMSDTDILGGSLIGDEIKQRVKELIKKYHPDNPDHELPGDVRTAIVKRLNHIKGLLDPRNKKEQPNSNKASQSPGEKSNTQINQDIQNIYDLFVESDKGHISCYRALTMLYNIERQYSVDLKKTKTQIVKLFLKFVLESHGKKSDEDYNEILLYLEKIETECYLDLTNEKEDIKKKILGKKKPWWNLRKSNPKGEKSNELRSLIDDILNNYRGSIVKSMDFQNTIRKLEGLERNHGAQLTKEKDEVVKLLVQEIMKEYRGSIVKSMVFENTMKNLIGLEKNYRAQLTKEKDEVVMLLVQEIMIEYRQSDYKSTIFENTIRKLEGLERNHGAQLTREKNEVVKLLVQEIMKEYRGSNFKSMNFKNTLWKLELLERNHGVRLTREKNEVMSLKDK